MNYPSLGSMAFFYQLTVVFVEYQASLVNFSNLVFKLPGFVNSLIQELSGIDVLPNVNAEKKPSGECSGNVTVIVVHD